MLVVGRRDPAQVEGAEQSAPRRRRSRRRWCGRPLSDGSGPSAHSSVQLTVPPERQRLRASEAAHRQRALARRIDVLEPVRVVELRRRRDTAGHDQSRGRAEVGAPVAVLGRPVRVRGIGQAARVAGPLVGHAGELQLRDDGARGVHQHLLDLVRREPSRDQVPVSGVERRGLRHRQHRRHERGGARGRGLPHREHVVRAVAGHVAAGAEGRGRGRALVLGQGVARESRGRTASRRCGPSSRSRWSPATPGRRAGWRSRRPAARSSSSCTRPRPS